MFRILWIAISIICFSPLMTAQSYRTMDGTYNNVENVQWGSKGNILNSIISSAFADSISELAGTDRPNSRKISNLIFSQTQKINSALSLSDYLWAFGQFIDHDIVLIKSNPFEPLFITVPDDDEIFEPGSSITMFRSEPAKNSGTVKGNPRKYENEVTAYVDGSGIYGSDEVRAKWLRTFEGGKLKTSKGNLLPWNTVTGEFNDAVDRNAPFMEDAFGRNQKLFVAGDVRANENPLLISLHTLFVREHNRFVENLKQVEPSLSDEELYQRARRKIYSYIQHITFNEWLPAMGVTMPKYSGYRPNVKAQISNVFSAAAFRLGHTLVNSDVLRMQNDGSEIKQGNIRIKDAFFNPLTINLAGGIEPYLIGMAQQVQQELDSKIIDDLRNLLFEGSPFGNLDLAAINITRGRERGLADYNSIRSEIGLPRLTAFEQFPQTNENALALKSIYKDIDKIDPWVGMLAEKHMPEAILGNTLMLIIERQFQRLRDGDRFYFENDPDLSNEEKEVIRDITLKKLIMRNANISAMQDNVFKAMDRNDVPFGPTIHQESLSAAIFPNPNNGDFTVKIYEDGITSIKISVYDALGKLIMTNNYNLRDGNNFIPVTLPTIAPTGFYNVLIEKEPIGYTVLRFVKK
ncbi:MAG: peroxidase family protein [Saprospiraceae bacterium]